MAFRDNAYPWPPQALIVTAQEWLSLSVDTLFSPRGYATTRGAFTSTQVMKRLAESPVDVLVLDRDLRDIAGVELCRLLIQRELVCDTTPIVLMAPSPWLREEKIAALRAGAWDTCMLPMDGEEFFLRVDRWVRAKIAGDVARKHGLLDHDTGLYNTQGLLRRMSELGATAQRHSRPLACVVVSPPRHTRTGADSPPWTSDSLSTVASTIRSVGRASDTFARLSANEFAVVAIDTDSDGVLRLAERMREALDALPAEASPPDRLRFGCYAVSNFRDASIAPSELLIRAAEALRGESADRRTIRFFAPPLDSS